ncbi:MAG: hypothetical protein ACI32O_01210 [Enterococcus sp.]
MKEPLEELLNELSKQFDKIIVRTEGKISKEISMQVRQTAKRSHRETINDTLQIFSTDQRKMAHSIKGYFGAKVIEELSKQEKKLLHFR